MAEETGPQAVQSVLRTFHLLDIVTRERKIGISELSRKAGLKKTTVARLVDTLAKAGVLEQDPQDRRYSLTIRLFEMGSRALENFDILRQSRPLIEEFVGRCGKSVLVSVLDHNEVVYVDKVEARELFRIMTSVGGRAPGHCSASGKVMFAFLPPERLGQILGDKPLQRCTGKTLTDYRSLLQDLAEIRRIGYSVDRGERYVDLCSVAAPLFDSANRVVAAVSVPRIAATINDAGLAELGREVALLARKISCRLGWTGEHD